MLIHFEKGALLSYRSKINGNLIEISDVSHLWWDRQVEQLRAGQATAEKQIRKFVDSTEQ